MNHNEPNSEVDCFYCNGKGWYSYATKPNEHHFCLQCNHTGKVSPRARKEAVDFFNETKSEWEKPAAY